MTSASPVSRRAIAGLIGIAVASPRAAAEQAAETVRDVILGDGPLHSGLVTGGHPDAVGGPSPLSIDQLAMKQIMKEANRECRRKRRAINSCRSMSRAAKDAYLRDAEQASRPAYIKFAKLMGWRATNDDFDEWD